MTTTLPVLPDPSDVAFESFPAQCKALVAWAQSTEDIAAILESKARLEAIGTYVEQRGFDVLLEVEAAARRLEARIGELLAEAAVGSHSSASEGEALTPNQRWAFRKMAAHPEALDSVLRECREEQAATGETFIPSRRWVLRVVKDMEEGSTKGEDPTEDDEGEGVILTFPSEDLCPTGHVNKIIRAMEDPDWPSAEVFVNGLRPDEVGSVLGWAKGASAWFEEAIAHLETRIPVKAD
jgi:hypothetical protein